MSKPSRRHVKLALLASIIFICSVSHAKPRKSIVAIIGDDTTQQVRDSVSQLSKFQLGAEKEIGRAKCIIVAQNATTGPIKVHGDIVKNILPKKKPVVLWVFTNMSQMSDRELMELVMMEILELFEKYKIDDFELDFAFDAIYARKGSNIRLSGWKTILDHIQKNC